METLSKILAQELNRDKKHIQNIIKLIDEGNTIPFIARYRKELHGAMDDTTLRTVADRLDYLRSLQTRRDEIKKAIQGDGMLTSELEKAMDSANILAELEDIYRPFKKKRRTRAAIAKEKGLEPLALLLLEYKGGSQDIFKTAEEYIDAEKEIFDAQSALDGASDIIAEMVSDSAELRRRLRELLMAKGKLAAAAAQDEDSVYSNYYDFEQPVRLLHGHQVLAINRGEKEGFLKASVTIPDDIALDIIWNMKQPHNFGASQFVKAAAQDGYFRLLLPSLQREVRSTLSQNAAEGAIKNFALNLHPLLMQPPVTGNVTMGLDPGYRNGCKAAVVDATGKPLDTAVVYPTHSPRMQAQAIETLLKMIKKHDVKYIAIGNGTASHETQQMVDIMLEDLPDVGYIIVNEAGASVYSVSKLATDELPQYDANLRSAISIARRLLDPLAELVKIHPKSIGVGQYQHDMPQKRLDEALAGVVESCVNAVGVDINTASPSLLQYISGLNSAIAANIVKYREDNGIFTSRRQLLKVPKLGAKTYQQCAGFLRVPGGDNILDNTGVHPESYSAAKRLIELCGYKLDDVPNGKISGLPGRLKEYGEERAAEECCAGIHAIRDIVKEIMQPGRDPRGELPASLLRMGKKQIDDMMPGTQLTGIVRNVIDFGAFVDIGAHQDGLVHISEIADRYIRHPSEVLTIGDIINVVVLAVDTQKNRISLSMKRAGKQQSGE